MKKPALLMSLLFSQYATAHEKFSHHVHGVSGISTELAAKAAPLTQHFPLEILMLALPFTLVAIYGFIYLNKKSHRD